MPFSLIPHENVRTIFAIYSNLRRPRILHNHCLINDLPTAQDKRLADNHCHARLLRTIYNVQLSLGLGTCCTAASVPLIVLSRD